MKTATTVFELSKILKISTSTVSRALKNHPDIAPETRDRVLALAQKLDYEPNLHAVGLRTAKSKEFAVIVPNLSGFFYHSFITSLERLAGQAGYSIFILLSGDDPAVESDHLKVCRQRKVAGVFACLTPRTNDFAPFLKLQRLKIPIIFFDKVPMQEGFTQVRVADERAALFAAEALIKSSRRRVLSIFGDMQMSISKRRYNAYIQTFKDHDSTQEVLLRHAINSEEAQQIVLQELTKEKKPDAIFCMSDEILIGAMKAIQILRITIPDQLGIIAISNGFFPKLYHPEITYVETSGEKLGTLAFSRMISYLGGDLESPDLIAETILVEGSSL